MMQFNIPEDLQIPILHSMGYGASLYIKMCVCLSVSLLGPNATLFS